MDVPVIKIELEGIRKRINHALMTHSGEFDKMIASAIDKSFNIETIQYKIDMQVAKALDNAIDGLTDSYPIKTVMKDIVVRSLEKVRDKLAVVDAEIKS